VRGVARFLHLVHVPAGFCRLIIQPRDNPSPPGKQEYVKKSTQLFAVVEIRSPANLKGKTNQFSTCHTERRKTKGKENELADGWIDDENNFNDKKKGWPSVIVIVPCLAPTRNKTHLLGTRQRS
jgi:hypothetical protein